MLEDTIKTKAKIDGSNLLAATLEQLNSASTLFQEQFLSSWEKAHSANLQKLLEIQENCLQILQRSTVADSQSTGLWQELETTIEKFLEQVASLKYVDVDYSAARLLEEWRKHFQETLEDIPASPEIAIPENYWDVKHEDSLRIRLWKGLKKTQIRFRKTGLKIRNKLRGLFGKPPLPSSSLKRSILVHPFLKFHYELPTARFFLQSWQSFLQQIAIQLHQMHETTEEMIAELLYLENFKEFYLKPDAEKLRSNLQRAREKLPARNSFFENLDKFKALNREQYESHLAQLNKNIEYDWGYGGTSVLPNGKFSEKKIARHLTNLEADFNKIKTAWIRHFSSESEDWNKDLELHHLKARIAQLFIETLDSFSSKINEQIIPSLAEPSQTLSDSLQKFQEMVVKKETELISEILAQNRLMLHALRKEKLPRIIDTIQQAQLLKTLDNYHSRVKHVVENLTDRHQIFRHRDLKSLPPNSKVVEITLKDLVFEEIYPGFSREYEALKNEIEDKLDTIVRDISEIDQIVEFNLQAAVELLEKDKETEALDEAQNVVVEGLERAKNQLNSLVVKTEQMIELSKETLLRITLDFERQIQELADNEKIIDLKLRVARARTKDEIRDYRRKILRIVKTTLPSLLNFLTTNLKKARSRYSRLRRMTGLAPVSADVEERLSKFIAKTQERITTLPYVYERLFRIQPLADERFFEGRNDDLARLEQEFDSWQSGQYGVTALVGEKGSGKTTLLNFAMDQIYSKLPTVKIDLAGSTISTEENLFLFFKNAFQENDIESLDELEDKFMGLERQRVIIVEDIQNLFLRTVDDFEALERFMLFISRTHEKILWVITCTLYSWRYLDRVINLAKYFQRVIFVGGLTSEDIENIVLKRHRVSGYKLLFEPTQELINSKKFKKLTTDESRQEFLKDFYFKQLNELAAGNISVTMMFWLSAINRIDQDKMIISSMMNHDFSFLDQLPAEELFTIAALLQHEMMTVEEHAKVFSQEIRQSLLLLNRMTNRGLLYQKSNGNYQINFLLYRAVVRTLSRKNIIH